MEWLSPIYIWLRAFHLIAVIAWMAGLFYLPRLYVYHADVAPKSPESEMLKIMERRLLRVIMAPASIAVWVLGISLIFTRQSGGFAQGWLHAKLVLVVAMTVMHHLYALWRKDFERDENQRPARFYRIANEIPTVLMIAIVILVIVKPF